MTKTNIIMGILLIILTGSLLLLIIFNYSLKNELENAKIEIKTNHDKIDVIADCYKEAEKRFSDLNSFCS